MTDFFHEWRWQGKHMHALYFHIDDSGQTFCPTCGETYHPPQKRKPLKPTSLYARDNERNQRLKKEAALTTTNTVTVQPEESKPERSTLVTLVFAFLVAGFLFVVFGALLSAPYLAALGVFSGLAAVNFAILSLRETAE